MVKQIILGHLKCWLIWDVYEELIYKSAVVGHRVISLDQDKGQDVRYSHGVISYRIRIYREITNPVSFCQSCVTMDT